MAFRNKVGLLHAELSRRYVKFLGTPGVWRCIGNSCSKVFTGVICGPAIAPAATVMPARSLKIVIIILVRLVILILEILVVIRS